MVGGGGGGQFTPVSRHARGGVTLPGSPCHCTAAWPHCTTGHIFTPGSPSTQLRPVCGDGHNIKWMVNIDQSLVTKHQSSCNTGEPRTLITTLKCEQYFGEYCGSMDRTAPGAVVQAQPWRQLGPRSSAVRGEGRRQLSLFCYQAPAFVWFLSIYQEIGQNLQN